MTVTGDDPKKFAAAMVEYSKEKVTLTWNFMAFMSDPFDFQQFSFPYFLCNWDCWWPLKHWEFSTYNMYFNNGI